MASEIDKILSELNGIAALMSDFSNNVFDKLIKDSESFNEVEYKESEDDLNNIMKIAEDLKRNAEKATNDPEKKKETSKIVEQIIEGCREIKDSLPKTFNKTLYSTQAVRVKPIQTAKKNGIKAGNQLMDSTPDQIYMNELKELHKQIDNELKAISDCRRKYSVAEGYDEEERHKISLEKHEKNYEMYFEKYRKLRSQINKDRGKISSVDEIKELEDKIDSLKTDFTDAIKDALETILKRFDESDKKIISSFSDIIDESQAATIDAIVAAFDRSKLNNEIINGLSKLIKADLREQNRKEPQNPSLAKKVFALTDQLKDEKSEIEVKHLVKLCIPIIPGLIKYETSLGLKGTKNLKNAWKFLVKKFGPKKRA